MIVYNDLFISTARSLDVASDKPLDAVMEEVDDYSEQWTIISSAKSNDRKRIVGTLFDAEANITVSRRPRAERV